MRCSSDFLHQNNFSDQGRHFESTLVAKICKCRGIHKTQTTPYHPQSDGLVEQFNCTLLDMLATTLADHPGTWEDHIPKVLLGYNTSTQSTTGFSPFFLMFCRIAQLPVNLVYGTTPAPATTMGKYAMDLSNTIWEADACMVTANPMPLETLYGSIMQQYPLRPQENSTLPGVAPTLWLNVCRTAHIASRTP